MSVDTSNLIDHLVDASVDKEGMVLAPTWSDVLGHINFSDKDSAYSILKKYCGSNHVKSGRMLDWFLQCYELNGARMALHYVPRDNYGVFWQFAFLSYWIAKQHIQS